MRFLSGTAIAMVAVCTALHAQQGQQQSYMERALIQHQNGHATVQADSPRPLCQAIRAVREQYGWVVDYEDPLYQSSDFIDTSPAAWRTAHPGKQGWMVPAGGVFQSTFPESPDMWSSASEELQALEKIVSDYNATTNPGKFTVREQADGSYAVIGISAAPPLLDAQISLSRATREAGNTAELIVSALSAKSGAVVRIGNMPFNLFHQSTATIGGKDIAARDLFIQLFQSMQFKMVWDLWYLPNMREWSLILHPAARAQTGAFGQRRLIPVSPLPPPAGPQ